MENAQAAAQQRLIGSLMVLLAAVGFSAKAVLVKLAYAYSVELDAITLMTLRMLFALPFFLVVAFWLQRQTHIPAPTRRELGLIAVLGILGFYLASLLDFSGLAYIPAGLERLILFLYPTLVVVFSALFYRRSITIRERGALVLSYLGIVVVFLQPLAVIPARLWLGVALVFGSAVVFALYLILSGAQLRRSGSIAYTAYAMTAASLAAGVHFGVSHPVSALDLPLQVYGLALLMALLSTVLPAFLMHAGIHRIGAGPASIMGSAGPVATLFLAWWLLDEPLTLVQMAGTAMILAGVVFVSRAGAPTQKLKRIAMS
ncbi:Permease of the drug/metabolite transporter (DMT) superfamily [hydrothermal vent metagenome]|uniref:Permease of the drug/metabolite transporter (DMT) superfamily n=1 Tax=hydrothermal vent metagenome TaxID=652676 RepID=A0A3B0Y2V1_9ZZZZ